MFKSLIGLATDVVKVAVAPVEIAVDVTRCVTKPLVDIAEEVSDEVKEAVSDITEDKHRLR